MAKKQDSIVKICKDIDKARKQIMSPVDGDVLDICERLARRIAAVEARLTRKIDSLDRATADARIRSARF